MGFPFDMYIRIQFSPLMTFEIMQQVSMHFLFEKLYYL